MEAQVKIDPPSPSVGDFGRPVRRLPAVPVAVRSNPRRIAPGQSARIALVFDKTDIDLDHGPVTVELFREGKWEFELALLPSDVEPPSKSEGAQ
jgi:hypothetical protein